MYFQLSRLRVYPAAVVLTAVMGSVFSPVSANYANQEPYQQEFVVTAYYSPLPDQCCYFRGSYEEEKMFNGEGVRGADGTAVYPGMLAAPPSYAFGTVIDLHGIGIGMVHDRGGRIIEWDNGYHRVDIWMGEGEEGLARAMEWGVRRVTGTVYPAGVKAPAENMVLANFPSGNAAIAALTKSDDIDLLSGLKLDDQRYGVRVLQQYLADLGYLDHQVTGLFGPATRDALGAFQQSMGLTGDGSATDDRTAAALVAALQVQRGRTPALVPGLALGSEGADVRLAQKVLRYVGVYRGRTDGKFDEDLRIAVVAFQRQKKLIADEGSPGAGRIGPITIAALTDAWRAKQASVKMNAVLHKLQVTKRVREEGLPNGTLVVGSRGAQVKQLQRLLSQLGYFNAKELSSTFGAKTKTALLKYQLDKKIVSGSDAHGAGVYGPTTRKLMMADAINAEWRRVRGSGL